MSTLKNVPGIAIAVSLLALTACTRSPSAPTPEPRPIATEALSGNVALPADITLPATGLVAVTFADSAAVAADGSFAVDTPRGLMVPVVRSAERLSLRALAAETKRLGQACQAGKVNPDELQGGTITVSNVGVYGVDNFTPILNPPQVAILGVGGISLRPVAGEDGKVEFIPHLGLSLTVNHMVVDGAPGARYLQALGQALAQFPLLLAQ